MSLALRNFFSNTWIFVTAAIVVLVYCYYCSWATGQPQWFQRSGSIVVLFGVLISARKIVRLGNKYTNEDWGLPDDSVEGRLVLLDEHSQYIIGPIVAVIGTIVWGYGDLFV